LKAHPHVGLNIFEHVAQMNGAIGIGQGAGYENLAGLGHGARLLIGSEEGRQLYSAGSFFSSAQALG